MQTMPQVAPLSQITKEAPTVGAMLEKGPVLLTAKAQRFGVLVSVEEWDQIAQRLERYEQRERNRIADIAFARMDNGVEGVDYSVYTSPNQIDALTNASTH